MTVGNNLLLWGSTIWMPWLMYVMLCNEAKPKKNIIVGATIPYAARQDAEMQKILARFKKEMLLTAILLTLPAVPCVFVNSFGVSMTLWLTWIVAACVVFFIPYARCNGALRRLKAEKGWKPQSSPQVVADLKAVTSEQKWISPLWFLLPFLISLIPLPLDPELWLVWGIDAAIVVLLYLCYRFCYRSRAEMVDDNTERTIALTRIRRYNWGKAWIIMAWATGFFNVGFCLTMDLIWGQMAVLFVYCAVVVWAMLRIEFRVRRLQESLCASSGQGFYLDDDDYWIWGLFYHNSNDSRLIVNNRVGINTSINLAKRSGQVLMGLLILLLLACPLFGIWMTHMEVAPVELSVTGSAIEAAHFGAEYTVALEDIESAELLDTLPAIRRVSGTGMPSAKTGLWNCEEWGRFTCCIDPREGPWLLLETGDGYFLFGGGNSTEAVYHAIQ